jgi:hypothetical protein
MNNLISHSSLPDHISAESSLLDEPTNDGSVQHNTLNVGNNSDVLGTLPCLAQGCDNFGAGRKEMNDFGPSCAIDRSEDAIISLAPSTFLTWRVTTLLITPLTARLYCVKISLIPSLHSATISPSRLSSTLKSLLGILRTLMRQIQ